jgi:thioredoxin-related protein
MRPILAPFSKLGIRKKSRLCLQASTYNPHAFRAHDGKVERFVKMPTSIKDKIEVTTNLLIILVLVLIGGSLVKAHFGHKPPGLSVGEQIAAPAGYHWQEHDQTLVVAVRAGCIYCEHSYPLYLRLAGLEHDNRLKAHMLVVMPDNKEKGAALLSAHGLSSQNISGTLLNNMKVYGTPTLLLVDANGRLLQSWIGELDASRADALLAQLRR